MAKRPALDAARKTFADITGLLEDAALLASEAQAVTSCDEGRRQCDRLFAALDGCLARLRRLRRRLE